MIYGGVGTPVVLFSGEVGMVHGATLACLAVAGGSSVLRMAVADGSSMLGAVLASGSSTLRAALACVEVSIGEAGRPTLGGVLTFIVLGVCMSGTVMVRLWRVRSSSISSRCLLRIRGSLRRICRLVSHSGRPKNCYYYCCVTLTRDILTIPR